MKRGKIGRLVLGEMLLAAGTGFLLWASYPVSGNELTADDLAVNSIGVFMFCPCFFQKIGSAVTVAGP